MQRKVYYLLEWVYVALSQESHLENNGHLKLKHSWVSPRLTVAIYVYSSSVKSVHTKDTTTSLTL